MSGSDPKPQRFYAEDLHEQSVVLFDGSTVTLTAKDGVIETSDPFVVRQLEANPSLERVAEKARATVSDYKRERE